MDKSKAPPGQMKPRKKGAKKRVRRKKRVFFKFREFKVTQPVDIKNYVMEYGVPSETVMEFRKGKIKYAEQPKLEVRESKASVLKDEFSGVCGRKEGIKNWLFYV